MNMMKSRKLFNPMNLRKKHANLKSSATLSFVKVADKTKGINRREKPT